MPNEISTKRVAISKSNAQMVAIVAAAAFVTIFCLIAAKAAFSQNRYLGRVSTAKEKAYKQLQDNITAYRSLQSSYDDFDKASTNSIGGSRDGTGDRDGSNSKIVLDALPSTYDFPALTSSLEKILADNNLKVGNVSGVDDQLNQEGASSGDPQAVEMPFSFSVTNANYSSSAKLLDVLEKSIRPIKVDSLILSGEGSNMTLTVNAHTYYQVGKNLDGKKEVIK